MGEVWSPAYFSKPVVTWGDGRQIQSRVLDSTLCVIITVPSVWTSLFLVLMGSGNRPREKFFFFLFLIVL